MPRNRFIKIAVAFALSMTVAMSAIAEDKSEDIFLHYLKNVSGFAFDPENQDSFTVATPHGIFSVSQENGLVQKINSNTGYLIELIARPDKVNVMFTSGYKSKEEKLGVLKSEDGGKTWSKVSDGAKTPVAFYAMAISASDPNVLYGADGNIQVSHDGGHTWTVTSDIPGERLFGLAISPSNDQKVYAATYNGLFLSEDGAKTWTDISPVKGKVAASVNIRPDGEIHLFLFDHGYLTASEKDMDWKLHAKEFQNRALLNIAFDPKDQNRIFGVADTGAVMISQNGGENWYSFEGHQYVSSDRIAKGKAIFQNNCIACHSENGIGEVPDDPRAVDDNGLPVAPALNDDAHAWHHSDSQLMNTILNGSPNNERMLAWKEHNVTQEDAESLVAYIKSLWNFNSLACQGPRHMSCMH